jgi:hypothetical protein
MLQHWQLVCFIGIIVCSQSGDHPLEDVEKVGHLLEDLAKSGYKPAIKYKSLIILLYVWLRNENQIYKSGDFYSFLFPHF